MFSGRYPSYNSTPDFVYDKAILAGAQFNVQNYRIGFDVSIPVFNSLTKLSNQSRIISKEKK